MLRLSICTLLALYSCQGPLQNTSSVTDSLVSNTINTTDSTVVSCDKLLSEVVHSSDAEAIKTFSHTTVHVRLSELSSEKLTIELYVVNENSYTADDPRPEEHTVGWLEFHRPNQQLMDITNDPENPRVLTYDSTLLQRYDLFKICTPDVQATSSKNSDTDVMLEEDIRFNGKLKRFFTISDFEKVFGPADSTKLLQEEAPCITIFDAEAPDDKYLYKDGSRFEMHQQQVAVDEFWFTNGNYITYKGIRIDANTSINDMKNLFPTAVMGKINEYREGELQLMVLKEDKEGVYDGHIKLFFKNGKVYFMHWWFPC